VRKPHENPRKNHATRELDHVFAIKFAPLNFLSVPSRPHIHINVFPATF
jgi:hypothetical protein